MTKFGRFLKCDGIGDTMDTLNLWIAAGFTMLVFAFLWTCRLTNVAMGETVCAVGMRENGGKRNNKEKK